MVCLVLPFITKGLTIILEYALALTLGLLFLHLILLLVTKLKSNIIYSTYILFAFKIVCVDACIYEPTLSWAGDILYYRIIYLWAYYYAYPNDVIPPIAYAILLLLNLLLYMEQGLTATRQCF